jgi:hypothetical protein
MLEERRFYSRSMTLFSSSNSGEWKITSCSDLSGRCLFFHPTIDRVSALSSPISGGVDIYLSLGSSNHTIFGAGTLLTTGVEVIGVEIALGSGIGAVAATGAVLARTTPIESPYLTLLICDSARIGDSPIVSLHFAIDLIGLLVAPCPCAIDRARVVAIPLTIDYPLVLDCFPIGEGLGAVELPRSIAIDIYHCLCITCACQGNSQN